jgi:hypothetical protein
VCAPSTRQHQARKSRHEQSNSMLVILTGVSTNEWYKGAGGVIAVGDGQHLFVA